MIQMVLMMLRIQSRMLIYDDDKNGEEKDDRIDNRKVLRVDNRDYGFNDGASKPSLS